MHRNKVIVIVVVSVIVIGIALGLALHVSRILAESRAVEISKQHPVVQSYINQHPNAEHRVMKLYLARARRELDGWKLWGFVISC